MCIRDSNYIHEPSSYLESTNSEFLYTATSAIINLNTLGDFVETDLESRNLKKTQLLVSKSQTFGFGVKKQNNWFLGFEFSQRLSSNFENKFLNFDILGATHKAPNAFVAVTFNLPDGTSIS